MPQGKRGGLHFLNPKVLLRCGYGLQTGCCATSLRTCMHSEEAEALIHNTGMYLVHC